jgi:hypothetical protein
VVRENWRLEIISRDGAELMERSKQWRRTVGARSNGVARDSGSFGRKPTEGEEDRGE